MHKNTKLVQANCCLLQVKEVRTVNRTDNKKDTTASYDENLKGTFISTIFVGLFVLLSWLAIFYIYMTLI